MKGDKEDLLLAEMLGKEAYQATENQWFTRRVINRLPPRRSHAWFNVLLYTIVAIVCVYSWRELLHSYHGVVTVRDIIYLLIMLAVTSFALISAMVTAIRTD